jgi:hypothetical protein
VAIGVSGELQSGQLKRDVQAPSMQTKSWSHEYGQLSSDDLEQAVPRFGATIGQFAGGLRQNHWWGSVRSHTGAFGAQFVHEHWMPPA